MNLEQALSELNLVKDKVQLEDFFQKYLGKKWLLNEEFAKMKDASPEEKKTLGWKLSEIKTKLMDEYSKKEGEISINEINEQLKQDIVDISVTGKKYRWWHFSLLAKTRKDMEKIAESMWFTVDYSAVKQPDWYKRKYSFDTSCYWNARHDVYKWERYDRWKFDIKDTQQ